MMLSTSTLLSTTRATAARAVFRPFSSSFLGHPLNCEYALKKAHEGESFLELSEGSVQILQGIGAVHADALEQLGLRSIQDLATFKFYHMAKAITVLKHSESEFRPETSTMNVNKALNKAFETKSFNDISEAPVVVLQGISEEKGSLFRAVGVTTVADLAKFKYCKWAESILTLSKYEV